MKRCSVVLACLVLGGVLGTYGKSVLQGQAPPREAAVAPAIPKELTSYRDIVKKVLPAVVSIEARAKPVKMKAPARRRATPFEDDPQGPEQFRRFFPQVPFDFEDNEDGPSPGGFGSGFIVDPKGVVMTNYHVVAGADQVEVVLADGRRFPSKEVKTDPKTDLAIVRIDAKGDLPSLELGDSSAMEIGDRVLAVGAPFRLAGTVTHGIISAKGRSLHMNMYEDFIQTDAAINPGNSGGPLVNLEGRVIGIDAAIKSRSGGFQGIGLAVSSNLAKNIMEQLLKHGVVHRGYLGVQIKDIPDLDLARRLGLQDKNGVLISRVLPDTPGARAGLKDGDVITAINGQPVKNAHDLQSVVLNLAVGKEIDLSVLRDGKPQAVKAKIEEQPAQFGTAQLPESRGREQEQESVTLDKAGLEVTDLTSSMARRLGFREKVEGVLITRVERDSLAARAGLSRGMVITKVDKKSVTSADELKDKFSQASLRSGVLLQVQSPESGTSFVLLKTGSGVNP
jgi:serine protease Do